MKKTIFMLLFVVLGLQQALAQDFTFDGLNYTVTPENTASPARNSGISGVITIPAAVTYNGTSLSVTSIGDDAFMDCSFTSITIPNSVNSIGNSAFYNCYGLTSVTIPDSVNSIGDFAFADCSDLTSVTIPNSVTSIGYCAFRECSGLTSVTIPNSVNQIGVGVFQNCSGLTSVTIPNSVTSIGTGAFRECSGLTSVTIPTTLTSIGDSAFKNCSDLTSVTIPNSLTSIGDSAFENCTALTSVVSEMVTPLSINSTVFLGVNQVACSLTVPNGSVSAYAAAPVWQDFTPINCFYLTGTTLTSNGINYVVTSPTTVAVGDNSDVSGPIIIPASVTTECGTYGVTSIGDQAFYLCSGLTSVTIPNSVTSIGDYAFYGCSGLTSVTIPNSVNSIGEDAFGWCSGLTSVTIPDTVTSIGNGAFAACSGLTSVTISNSVNSIGDSTFDSCAGLTSVTIPNSVKSIGESAFAFCTGLTSVTIPNSVKSIGQNAFGLCSSLKSITIPNSVTSIGLLAFSSCSGLTSVTIGNSVTSIGNQAFQDCSGLTTVTIPNSVTSIGMFAFYGCSGLTSVVCEMATPLSINSNVFQAVNQGACSLTVPAGSIAAYEAADVWKHFTPICAPTENTTTVTACSSYTWNGIVYTTSGIKTGTTTNCVTEKLNLTIDITTAPTASAQSFCAGKTVADLVATGTDLKWYDVATNGTALTPTSAITSGNYYVSQTLNSCEGPRTSVAVTVTPQPAAPTVACYETATWNSDTCEYDITGTQPANPNAVNIDVNLSSNCAPLSGTFINSGLLNGYYDFQLKYIMGIFHISYDGTKWVLWENNDISNTGFMSSSNASNGLYPPTTGWIPTGCEAGDLTWSYATPPLACYQTVTFNSTSCAWDVTGTPPAMPTASAQSFCGSKTVANLVANGTDIKWYAAETGGTALASTTAIATGTYYVSQTINSCESTRTEVAVTVNNSVAGTVSNDQLIFIGSPPADITLTGNEGTVQWQSSLDNSTFTDMAEATGTTLTRTQMGALTTKSYYRAVITNGSCTATSGVVTVTVVAPTKVQASLCGKTLASLSTPIIANSVSGATHYRFKVTFGNSTENIETASRWFYLKSVSGGGSYGTTYTISVATKHNGAWGPYGDECYVTTPGVPSTKVQASQCGQTLAALNTAIIANTISGATNYRFKVVNGATTRYAETTSRWFYLKSLTGGASFTTIYTISVATKYNGVWGDYGDECNVTTPAVPATKVQDLQCGTTIANLNTAIVANTVSGATNYRFKVVNGTKTRYAEMANRWVRLTALTGGALFNTTYTISVATKNNGVWSDYGDECSVTTPSAPLTRPADLETETALSTFTVTGYPNPYTNTFQLDLNTQSNAIVNVRVYDMIGKLIEVRNSGVAELGTMEIGDRYATGVYNVIVTQGTEVKTLRMIKK